MRNRVEVPSVVLVVVAFAALLPWAGAFAAGPPADKGQRTAEMPMRVQTEGTTYGQYLQRQADLMTRLRGSVPAAAMHAPVRVDLSREEIDGVERAPRVNGMPQRIGLVKGVNPMLAVDGVQIDSAPGGPRRGPGAQASRTADGGLAWAVEVSAAGAGALRVHLEGLSLPASAELYFYSRAGEVFGPYRGAGPDGDGDLWTDTVFGAEGILELHVAAGASPADLQLVAFRVTEVGIVMPRFAGSFTPAAVGFCGDPDCIVDATCVTGTAADAAKDAVAKMEWAQGQFLYTCTGGLIADSNPAQDNFFLTAAHCLGNNKTARNLQFYWRFRTSSCNGTCPINTGWPYKTMGSTVASTGKKGDYTLLHLDAVPPANSVFLGWTNVAVALANGTHLYRISNPDFGPQVYSQHDVDTAAGTCGGWPRGGWIYSRDIMGAIDGGSSGSPIINGASQIVGQLSGTCGGNPSDACSSGPGEANATVDGAFAGYYSSIQPIINP